MKTPNIDLTCQPNISKLIKEGSKLKKDLEKSENLVQKPIKIIKENSNSKSKQNSIKIQLKPL